MHTERILYTPQTPPPFHTIDLNILISYDNGVRNTTIYRGKEHDRLWRGTYKRASSKFYFHFIINLLYRFSILDIYFPSMTFIVMLYCSMLISQCIRCLKCLNAGSKLFYYIPCEIKLKQIMDSFDMRLELLYPLYHLTSSYRAFRSASIERFLVHSLSRPSNPY